MLSGGLFLILENTKRVMMSYSTNLLSIEVFINEKNQNTKTKHSHNTATY